MLNAVMQIAVRVAARAAEAELARMQKQMAGLRAEQSRMAASSTVAGGSVGLLGTRLIKTGSQMQWVGRQLTYNFTIPLAIAGAAATKFALDNEKAMVRIQKVYGDVHMSQKQMLSETRALGKAFVQLSDIFGVNQAEVLNIAGDWAAAGASGVALAKATQLTLRTMVLGEMDAATATKALISIQAQYGFSTKQLSRTINTLNMVENQTGTSLNDLVLGFARAAGVARSAGIDTRHLAALIAALTPAAGSATQAGNGLKTMLANVMAPSKSVSTVLQGLGIHIHSVAWESLNGIGRLKVLAERFKTLSGAQRLMVATTIAGKYQLNRFNVLMREMTSRTGYYAKALNATKSPIKNFKQAQKELNMVLKSNPQRLKQTWVILQNGLSKAIMPLIPAIVALAGILADAARWFSNLDPRVQSLVIHLLAFMAIAGPIIRLKGAFTLLFGVLFKTFGILGAITVGLGTKILWLVKTPFKLLFTAAGAVFGGIVKLAGIMASGVVTAVLAMTRGLSTALLGQFLMLTKYPKLAFAELLTIVRTAMAAMLPTLLMPFKFAGGAIAGYLTGILKTVTVFLAAMAQDVIMFGARAILPALLSPFKLFAGGRLGALFSTAMGAVVRSVSAGLVVIVDGMATAVRYIGALWMRLPVIIEAAFGWMKWVITSAGVFTALLGNMFAAIGARIVYIWGIVSARLAATSLAIWRGIAGIFAAGGRVIAGMLVALGTSLARIWTTIVEFMALAWTKLWTFLASGGLFGRVVAGVTALGKAVGAAAMFMGRALLSPWTLAVAAVALLVYSLRDKLGNAWRDIANGFSNIWRGIAQAFKPVTNFFKNAVRFIIRVFDMLPQGVRDALMAVVRIVAEAAKEVYHLFSYLNPFAHHSPSLVESVQGGMKEVNKHYATTKHAAKAFPKAAQDLKTFKAEAARPVQTAQVTVQAARPVQQQQQQQQQVTAAQKKIDLSPSKAAVDSQRKVVDQWKAKLDAANASLDKQQKILDRLQNSLQHTKDMYDAASQKMQDFANAPIKGMQKMQDKIFANDQAQKRLQLRMLNWSQNHGSLDDLNNKLSGLNGTIQDLQGQAAALRAKGAGSDVLGPINNQIKALQKQASATQTTIDKSPMAKWQKQLDALGVQGQKLDLLNSLKFDPLEHQIGKLANTQKELSYKQIVDGIKKQKAIMERLQPTIERQTAAVNRQQKVVNAATKSRDAIQRRYDSENRKLQKLDHTYTSLSDKLNTVGKAAKKALTPLQQFNSAFGAAGKGNFPDPGGKGKIGREGIPGDQSKQINALTRQYQNQLGGMLKGMDFLGPFKDMWNKSWAWIKKQFGPAAHIIGVGLSQVIKGIGEVLNIIGHSAAFKAFISILKAAGLIIENIFKGIGHVIQLFWPDIQRIIKAIGGAFVQAWHMLLPAVKQFGDLIKPIGKILAIAWTVIKPLAMLLGGAFLLGFKLLASVISHTVGPVLTFIIRGLRDFLNVIHGVLSFIVDILTGQWSKAWHAVLQIFSAVWDEIANIISGAWNIIKGIVMGVVNGIKEFFSWLYNILIGHSIIPDLVNGIIKWFNFLIKPIKAVFQAIWNGIKWTYNNIAKPMFKAIEAYVKTSMKVFWWVWNNIIRPAWKFIWNTLKALWNSVGKPVFRLIENSIKTTMKVFEWIWSNIIRPAWRLIWNSVKTLWNSVGKPVFNAIESFLKSSMKVFWWVWNNLIHPAVSAIWNGIKSAWNNVGKPIWDGIKNAIHTLGDAFNTVKHVVSSAWQDIWNGIKSAWNTVKSDVLQPVLNTFASVVNGFIHAINFIIRAIDKVAGWIGLDVNIGTINTWNAPQLAKGGVVPVEYRAVGSGFKTNRPRAIVGEGGSHPEYVVPTDPRYRKRAHELYRKLGNDLGMQRAYVAAHMTGTDGGGGGTPRARRTVANFEPGHITNSDVNVDIGLSGEYISQQFTAHRSLADKLGDQINKIGGFLVRNAIKAAFWPFKEMAQEALKAFPDSFDWMRKWGQHLIDLVWHKVDSIGRAKDKNAKPYNWGYGQEVDRFGPVALEGIMRVMGVGNIIEDVALIPHVLRRMQQESGGNPNAINTYDINAQNGDPSRGLMQTIGTTFNAYRSHQLPDYIYDPRANMYAGLNYAQHAYGSIQRAMDKSGGYANGTKYARGGWAWAGERGPELVNFPRGSSVFPDLASASMAAGAARNLAARITPGSALSTRPTTENTTHNVNKSKSVTINIAKVEFPNVKTSADAEGLLRHLEILAD